MKKTSAPDKTITEAVLASAHRCGTDCRSRTAPRTRAIGTATPETYKIQRQGNLNVEITFVPLIWRYILRLRAQALYNTYAAVAELSLALQHMQVIWLHNHQQHRYLC
jgi:erythromycin esterase-like protein